MRLMRYLAIAGLALSLGGCGPGTKLGDFVSTVKASVGALSSASVPPKAVLVAATAFDGAERIAEQYLRLPICQVSLTRACRNPALTEPIAGAVSDGRAARDTALTFLKDHPGQLGPSGVYDALVSSTGLLKKILKDNGVTS